MTECIHGQEFESCSFGCTLKKNELRLLSAKLFTPKPWTHSIENTFHGYKCSKCDCVEQLYVKDLPASCTVPDPIDINDWNVAMRLFREAIEHERPNDTRKLVKDVTGMSLANLLIYGKKEQFIKAACEAKERE